MDSENHRMPGLCHAQVILDINQINETTSSIAKGGRVHQKNNTSFFWPFSILVLFYISLSFLHYLFETVFDSLARFSPLCNLSAYTPFEPFCTLTYFFGCDTLKLYDLFILETLFMVLGTLWQFWAFWAFCTLTYFFGFDTLSLYDLFILETSFIVLGTLCSFCIFCLRPFSTCRPFLTLAKDKTLFQAWHGLEKV